MLVRRSLRSGVLLLAALLSACRAASPLQSIGLQAEIDGMARDTLRSGPMAGLSLAILHEGDVLHASGYGMRDVEAGLPAERRTVYPIASVSKHLTAALALRLVDQGVLTLDDPIDQWIPPDPRVSWLGEVTLRQLLSHSAGVYNFTRDEQGQLDDPGKAHSRDYLLDRLANRPLDFSPGTHMSYSNGGFLLVGEVIRRATGGSYLEALREHVLGPLGLEDTASVQAPSDRAEVSKSYLRRDGTFHLHDRFATIAGSEDGFAVPAGFLRSSALDLVRLEEALTSLLSAASLAAMRAPTRLADGSLVGYGLGTRLGSLRGHEKVGHTGGFFSYRSVLAHYPGEKLTIAIVSNSDLQDPPVDVLDLEARIACRILEVPIEEVVSGVPGRDLSAYAGRYESGGGSVLTIRPEGNGLSFFTEAWGEQTYLPLGGDRFYQKGWPAHVWSIEFQFKGDRPRWIVGRESGGFESADWRYAFADKP